MSDIEANEGGAGIFQTSTTVDSTDSSVFDSEGNTALHRAVLSISREGNENEVSYRDIDDLMKRNVTTLNMPNSEGYSAIGCAMQYSHKKCIERMLNHESASLLHLDYYPGDSQLNLREIITDNYPDLQPRLPNPITQSLESSDRDTKLLAALQHNKYDIFRENLDSENRDRWYDEPYYCSLLEIACQMKHRKQFVTLLLDSGADPNIKNCLTDMPLLHATARSGNFEVLEILLKKKDTMLNMNDNKKRTILHWLAQVSGTNKSDTESLKKCFEICLSQSNTWKVHLNKPDSSGNTPFSISVKGENLDSITLFFEDAFYHNNENVDSVLKSAKKSLLERILDSCLGCNDEPLHSENLEVKFKVWPLVTMMGFALNTHHEDLMTHPVPSLFVNIFWKKMKYLFFLNVAFYTLFLLILTTYILYSEFYNTENITMWYVLMVLLGLLFMRELCQLLLDFTSYIKSKENWLEILLIALTFTSCSGLVESTEINRHFFAIAILLGWFELVLLWGRLPVLSVQTEMLKKVSLTFLKYMAGYSVLLFAFAFCFYILFKESVDEGDNVIFGNPFISILRTSVMFAGEFNASDLPFDTLPGTSHVIFLLFVFFVAIVLLNLLNGLAVGDTRKIREHAEALSLAARVKLIIAITYFYKRLPDFIISFEITQEKSVSYPNRQNKISSSDKESLKRIITQQREESERVKSTEHVENWKLFAEQMAALQLQSNEIRQVLIRIENFLGIPDPLKNFVET